MKFKNYIETESGIKDTSTSPGTAGQVLSSTVTGTSWIDPDTLVSAASKLVVIACKNTSGSTIDKGTPVYQTGTVGATDVIEVAPADATITTGYLPAIGILQTTLINNNDPVTDPGNVVITGEFLNYSTLDIPSNNPGGVPITGDTVYLAPGGGLTCIKPTGAGNAIQNLGLIGKVSGGNAGSITVSSIMRANDVPNLPTGRIWIGDGNTIVSDTVYVDEPNNRVGIGTTSPSEKLTVRDGTSNTDVKILAYNSAAGTEATLKFSTIASETNYEKAAIIARNAAGSFGRNDMHFALDSTADSGNVQFSDTKMTILNGGNVGIGITDPGAKLEVVGESGVIIDSGTSNQAKLTLIGDAGTYGGGGIIDVIGAPSDYVAYNLNVKRSPNSIEASNFYSAFTRSWLWDGNMGSIANQPYTSYNFKSEGSSQMVIYNNNVGIGTTSPSVKLEVESTTSASGIRIKNTNSGFASIDIESNRVVGANLGGLRYRKTGEAASQAEINYVAGTRFDFLLGSGASSPAQKLSILQGGNVGIGTNAPTELLHISSTGPARLLIEADTDNVTETDNAQIILKQDGGAVVGRLGYRTNTNDLELLNEYTSNIYLGTSNSIRATLHANGNFGIGNSTPQAKLHVSNGLLRTWTPSSGTSAIFESTVSNRNFVTLTAVNEAELWFGNATIQAKGRVRYEMANNNMEFWTNATQKMVIEGLGNVGIGTTDPSAKLDVEGNANIGSLHTNFAGASYNVNLGFQNYNNGFAAIATGQNTLADASQSFSMGFQSKATGAASLAGGNVNTTTALPSESAGTGSIAFGSGVKTNSNANYSQAFGRGTETGGGLTSANQAMAMGFGSIAFGDNSFSGGNNSRAFGEASFAFGEGASASKGDGNIALGIGVTTPASASAANGVGQVAVGKYNVYNTAGVSHLFAVGAGTSDGNRFNAFNVTSNGRIGINGITNPSSILHAKLNDYSTGFYMEGPSLSTTFNYMAFYGGTTFRGAIIPEGDGINYSSASDYRLKENVTKLQNSIERIKKLKPSNFNFLENPSKNIDGFIAHEVQEVVPQAVTGKKDAVGPNGEPIYQAIDQAKIIPLLTAALQESITKIEQLEQRIQTLENK